ncbi:MAG: DUF3859 domain-containing protein [Humidesulfovibrio sp.]|jgi:hypothetical protein|uniref:DUF3859 domain-containing protein n=1 Tax=Humidesulfovibrio sp. TaxID=2910988 RepID=UPI002732DBA8|nr:DUF3859 domain-containing protein [Humidesulfovibrio sp.]MDP2847573.1 DUF3859 domain-containing protein [Humidesulfovibrio sp.]
MRKKTVTWFVAVALTLFCAFEAMAQGGLLRAQQTALAKVTGIKVLAVGTFSSTVESRAYTPSVADGIRDQARDFTLARHGAAAEASLDVGIGLRYQLTGSPKGAAVVVDVVVEHPQIVNPDTQLPMTHSTAQFERVIGEVEHSVWNFDTQADLVPGEYVIEILHKGRLLARQAFQVTVKP